MSGFRLGTLSGAMAMMMLLSACSNGQSRHDSASSRAIGHASPASRLDAGFQSAGHTRSYMAVGGRRPSGRPGQRLWLIDATHRPMGRLGGPRGAQTEPAWSSNRRYVYFTTNVKSGLSALWRYDVAGQRVSRVARPLGYWYRPLPNPVTNELAATTTRHAPSLPDGTN